MDREEEAWKELDQSRLKRGVRWVLIVPFLVMVIGVFVADLWNPYGPRDALRVFSERSRPLQPEANFLERGWAWNRENLADIESFENQTAEESLLRETVSSYQWFFVEVLKTSGTGRVMIGRDHWYFLKEALETSMGLGADESLAEADAAVRRLAGVLRARGIELVLVPVPGKPDLLPSKFSRRFEDGESLPPEPKRERVYQNWAALPGVTVIPVRRILSETGGEIFLERDTHWTPAAMMDVAQEIAIASGRVARDEKERSVARMTTGSGDLVEMMQLPDGTVPRQSIETFSAPAREKEAANAEIFFLGDSFAAIYSDSVLGWGEGAGLMDWLPVLAGENIDFRLNYGDPVEGPGGQLQRLLRSEEESLMPRVVVWQFAERFLDESDWSLLFRSN